MSVTLHPSCEEFRFSADRLMALKATDARFSRMIADFHDLGRVLHAAEKDGIDDAGQVADLRQARQRLRHAIARSVALEGSAAVAGCRPSDADCRAEERPAPEPCLARLPDPSWGLNAVE